MMEKGSPGHPRVGEEGGRRQVMSRGAEGSTREGMMVPRFGASPVRTKVTVSVGGEGEEAGRGKFDLG